MTPFILIILFASQHISQSVNIIKTIFCQCIQYPLIPKATV